MKVAIPKDVSGDERKLLTELRDSGGAGAQSKDGKKKAKGGKVRHASTFAELSVALACVFEIYSSVLHDTFVTFFIL